MPTTLTAENPLQLLKKKKKQAALTTPQNLNKRADEVD